MSNELNGRIALVTGASRGIGRAIAIALAQAGADVAVNFVSREAEAEEVCSEIKTLGRRTLGVKANASVSTEVSEMIAQIDRELGKISILVNNAGISQPQPLEEITERDWDEILTVNLKSMFLVTQAVFPGMRKHRWGRIINLSSVAAQLGGVIGAHYAASKAGCLGLTHSYAALDCKAGGLSAWDAKCERLPVPRFHVGAQPRDYMNPALPTFDQYAPMYRVCDCKERTAKNVLRGTRERTIIWPAL